MKQFTIMKKSCVYNLIYMIPNSTKSFGRLLVAKGNLSVAISQFQTALQLDPHDTQAREFSRNEHGHKGE